MMMRSMEGALERDELESLAERAQTGDPAAFDELARVVSGRMMSLAQGTLRDRSLAEEAVQEALTRIYRNLGRYERGSFLAWSLQIARNVCVDVAQRERRQQHLRLIGAEENVGRDEIDSVDVKDQITLALGSLSEEQRTAFLLLLQGLRYEEIARIVGVPIGTVRSRVFHARAHLRHRLAELWESR